MHRNRGLMNELMFIFSAKSFRQMYRRMRFMREYATYQRVQGEMVISKQHEIHQKHTVLTKTKHQKSHLLNKGVQEQKNLEGKQTEQKSVVSSLQKEQKTIHTIIDKQRQKDAALNAQIDRLIAQEIARAKARAEAEAKRQAAAAAARKHAAEVARQRAAELARKKAEALAAARENARRIAEAKKKEEALRREAQAASQREKAEAQERARQARAERQQAERQAAAEAKAHQREVAQAAKASSSAETASSSDFSYSSDDRRVSGNFESNRGRLPMPITGGYKIVSHFGQYNVEGLHNVRLDNKGINIQGHSGAMARSIYDGEVSAVFSFGGSAIVMVRHGSYISVYCNLASVCVSRGQHVSTRQALGRVGAENILQFQLRRETAKLNPEAWLGR